MVEGYVEDQNQNCPDEAQRNKDLHNCNHVPFGQIPKAVTVPIERKTRKEIHFQSPKCLRVLFQRIAIFTNCPLFRQETRQDEATS
jgi:hypothetical protein